MTIKDFLLARIAEDEEVARAALPLPDVESPRWLSANLKRRFGIISSYEADHISRHDPARVLAECAAKRAIIEAHPIVDDVVEVSTRIKWGFGCGTCFSYGDMVEDHGYCDTLRALASVYSAHPDYQEEWKP